MGEAFTGMILGILALFLGWVAFQFARGCYRYYRDNRPNRYAPRVRRIDPVTDTRSSIHQFRQTMRH